MKRARSITCIVRFVFALRIYSITYHFVAIGVLILSVIDNHYAEGSLQPIITRTIIFDKIPTAMPFFLLPILSFVFKKVHQVLDGPELGNNSKMVHKPLWTAFFLAVLTVCWQIESHLETRTWFAGGDHPTSADFLMGFTLEIMHDVVPQYVGPKVIEYLKRIQERPAYKRVRISLPARYLCQLTTHVVFFLFDFEY